MNLRLGISVLALLLLPVNPLTAQDLESGVKAIATSLSESLMSGDVRKIAVVEFTNLTGYKSALEAFVAEELVTQLFVAKPGAFDVVERRQLTKVLAEQQLSSSALFDADTIARVGEILGIQAIVTGSIADLGEEIKINARVISVATAKVFAATSAKSPKKGMVDALMRQAAGPTSLSSSAPGGASANRQAQQSDVFFQNSFMRITVDSISLTKDKKGATIALLLENLEAVDLRLALDCPSMFFSTCMPVRLVSNMGSSLLADCDEDVAGLGCTMNPRRFGAYTTFSGKSRSSVVFKMTSENGEEIQGALFSLGLELLRLEGEEPRRYSAGISNIDARQ